MIYLDNSATTRVMDDAAQAAFRTMTDNYANPASVYRFAVETDRHVEAARANLARALGALPGEIVYTSCATESNNLAIFGVANVHRGRRRRFITTQVEHPSVFETFRALDAMGQEVVFLGVNPDGTVRTDQLASALNENTALVSIMHVNNEVGAINDLDQIAGIMARYAPNAVFHSDGVQAFAKLPFDPVPAQLYSISGHKFNAPKGVGALMIRQRVRIGKGLLGGSQERGIRSGTLNTPGILGMDAAIRYYIENGDAIRDKLRQCKQRLMERLLAQLSDVYVNGPDINLSAPHILNLSFTGVLGEVLLHALEEYGICVSTGSACSQKKNQTSNRVLEAMGLPNDRARSALRISLGMFNKVAEMDTVAEAIIENVNKLRKIGR